MGRSSVQHQNWDTHGFPILVEEGGGYGVELCLFDYQAPSWDMPRRMVGGSLQREPLALNKVWTLYVPADLLAVTGKGAGQV